MTVGTMLGLGRPNAERMFGEDFTFYEQIKEPDLLHDPWASQFGEEETMFLLDKEQRRRVKMTVLAMVGRRTYG